MSKATKKEYKTPKTFPKWSKVDPKLADKQIYYPKGSGVEASFENNTAEHTNHIEMAGFDCSALISYRIKKHNDFKLYRFVVFPSLRVNPNNTHGSLCEAFEGPELKVHGDKEKAYKVRFDGILRFETRVEEVTLERSLFPAVEKKALIEEITLSLPEDTEVSLKDVKCDTVIEACYTPYEEDITLTTRTYLDGNALDAYAKMALKAGEHSVVVLYAAEDITLQQAMEEKEKRLSFLQDNLERLRITTPNEDINREIQLSKLRASESIFRTKGGLMHSPGGGNYYAALWTNDQCEYTNPFFAYLGYDKAEEQSRNCFDLFSKLVSENRAVYSSICAEGDAYWHGAGDRGDTSMFVYGFTRYLLTTGDRENAKKYLPALETACRFIENKINADDVVESDSDELENRLESGSANLSTAVISYDAFLSMAYLEGELGRENKKKEYLALADWVKWGISDYFESNVEGYETYRYCKEERHLRSWICLPLTVGINDRLKGTLAALKSKKLRKPCGLLSRSGESTYWDRSLLYALRGIFYAGKPEDALEMLEEYTYSRLYCGHVPYPMEAFPEGNGAHLSAESALYVRIVTEGVLGFRPIGFDSFELKLSIPNEWNVLDAERFVYAGKPLDIHVIRVGNRFHIKIDPIDYEQIVDNNQKIIIKLT